MTQQDDLTFLTNQPVGSNARMSLAPATSLGAAASSLTPKLKVTGLGFWLPTDEIAFFHHNEDKPIRDFRDLTAPKLVAEIEYDPATSAKFSPHSKKSAEQTDSLQSSIYRRLVTTFALQDVAPKSAPTKPTPEPDDEDAEDKQLAETRVRVLKQARKTAKRTLRCRCVLPIFHLNHIDDDPYAALFYSEKDDLPAQLRDMNVQGLGLLVNANGSYLWLATYPEGGDEEKIQKALRTFVMAAVGGWYYSHFSGAKDERHLASNDEKLLTLKDYQEGHLGILTFSQINTILEGLYSYTLDFLVFFLGNSAEYDKIAKNTRRRYSLGRFIERITEPLKTSRFDGGGKPPTNEAVTTPMDPMKGEPVLDPKVQAARTLNPALKIEVEAFLRACIEQRTAPPSSSAAPGAPGAPKNDNPLTYLPRQLYHLYLGDDRYFDTTDDVQQDPDPKKITVTLNAPIPPPPLATAHEIAYTYSHTTVKGANANSHTGYSAYLLRRFLRITSSESLLPLKRRIERCRRALLQTMIEITHRHQPLLQIELPHRPGNKNSDESNRITGVTENQLRGFIMLISAKLPLISNVGLYLEELRINKESLTESPGVSGPYRTWATLVQSLRSDLDGLERAIQQAQTDTLVHEEREIRAEEETITEIERLRARNSGSLSPATSLALGVFANAFALIGVLAGAISLYNAINSAHPPVPLPSTPSASTVLFIALFLLAALVALLLLGVLIYAAIHYIGEACLKAIQWALHRRNEHEERYYYEMDIHLDIALDPFRAQALLDCDFSHARLTESDSRLEAASKRRTADALRQRTALIESSSSGSPAASTPSTPSTPSTQAGASQVSSPSQDRYEYEADVVTSDIQGDGFYYPITLERKSYRTERIEENEAIHKVYIEIDTRVQPNPDNLPQRFWHFLGLPVHAVLVYELLFHRPSQEHRYILQDLRVVINHADVLTRAQLGEIKRLVIVKLINHWISDKENYSARLRTAYVAPPKPGAIQRAGATGQRPATTADRTSNQRVVPPDALMSLNLNDDVATETLPARHIYLIESFTNWVRAVVRRNSLFQEFAFASFLAFAIIVAIRLVLQSYPMVAASGAAQPNPTGGLTLQQFFLIDILRMVASNAPAYFAIPLILVAAGAFDAAVRSFHAALRPSPLPEPATTNTATATRSGGSPAASTSPTGTTSTTTSTTANTSTNAPEQTPNKPNRLHWLWGLAIDLVGIVAPFFAFAGVLYLFSLFGVPIP